MKKRLAVALLAFALPSVTFADNSWKRGFQEGYASQNSWERAAAVKALDPNKADQLAQILQVAKEADWYCRGAAADALAKKLEAKTTAALEKQLKSADPLIAEVVATAFARSKDKARLAVLVAALKENKAARVRRACAIGLGDLPDATGIAALVEDLDRESADWLTLRHVLEALTRATGVKDKRTAADWKAWLKAQEKVKAAEGEPAPDEEQKGAFAGAQLRYVASGHGSPVLVLPDYSYEPRYLEPYLRKLEDKHAFIAMHLPGVKSFDPPLPNAAGLGMPYYPLDKICDAFEAMRLELVKQKKLEDKPFAILAHGLSAWIALRYARHHPEGVSKIVLAGALPSDTSFFRSLQSIQTTASTNNDLELAHFGKWLQLVGGGKSLYNPQGQDEWVALWRKGFSADFVDQQELEIGRVFGNLIRREEKDPWLYPELIRNAGGCVIPTFDVGAEPPIKVPLLVCAGAKAFFGSEKDAKELVRKAEKPTIETFPKGSMPWIEDGPHFYEVFEKFLGS